MRKLCVDEQKVGRCKTTFNVAASIKMRKYLRAGTGHCLDIPLQCGRIYKDAEIVHTLPA